MATATLQAFNAFLTDKLTAAAVDIFGFVERTILDYQEEMNRTKLENQRLQRLLDLIYKPEIRLHRAGTSRQTTVSATGERQGVHCPHLLPFTPSYVLHKESIPSLAHWMTQVVCVGSM